MWRKNQLPNAFSPAEFYAASGADFLRERWSDATGSHSEVTSIQAQWGCMQAASQVSNVQESSRASWDKAEILPPSLLPASHSPYDVREHNLSSGSHPS